MSQYIANLICDIEIFGNDVMPNLNTSQHSGFTSGSDLSWTLIARLKVKHLMLLAELGETGRLRQAAMRLKLTQPAASRLLRDAENAFGRPLFERSRRGVTPTDAGMVMIRRSRILLQNLSGAQEELSVLQDHVGGRVSVGVVPVATPELLPAGVLELRKIHPSVLISVQEGTNSWLLPALEHGEFDCVIGRMIESMPDTLEWRTLHYEVVYVVCGPDHALLYERNLTLESLVDFEWIMPHRAHPFRQQLEARFVAAGLPCPKVLLESESLIANASLLRRTKSLAMMPSNAAKYLSSRGAISILPFEIGATEAPVGVFLRKGVEVAPALAGFLEAVSRVAIGINDVCKIVDLNDNSREL